MTLLEIFFILSWIVILIIAFDVAKKQKFNALHFLVFFWIWWWLLIFSIFPDFLNYVWNIFWLQRWADLLVYTSIVFLLYFVLLLLNKIEWTNSNLTKLVRTTAIENSAKNILNWKIWFLVRVYNEEKVIFDTLKSLFDSGFKNIVVIDDWSSDNSLKEINKFEKVVLLKHYINRWWWAALETWFEYFRKYSSVEYVCTFDADGQHQIKDLEKFLFELENNKDLEVVLWSRFIKKTNTNIKIIRKIILKLWILFTFFVSNIKLTDSHNWYRVFRKSALDKIKLTIDDMSYASELVDIISEKNIKFIEVPVDIIYTQYSLSKWQKSSNAINIALKFIWSKFFR